MLFCSLLKDTYTERQETVAHDLPTIREEYNVNINDMETLDTFLMYLITNKQKEISKQSSEYKLKGPNKGHSEVLL